MWFNSDIMNENACFSTPADIKKMFFHDELRQTMHHTSDF